MFDILKDTRLQVDRISAMHANNKRVAKYNERDMELAYLRGWEDARRGLAPDYRSVVS